MKLRRIPGPVGGRRTLLVIALLGLVCLSGCRWQAQARRNYHLHKAQNYVAKQKYAEAAIEFRDVLKLDPNFADGYFQLGDAERHAGRYADAAAAFRRALDLNPKAYPAALQLGEIYLMAGDAPHALQLAQSILANRPNDIQGTILLAKSYMGMKKYPEAVKNFEKAEQLDPSNATVYLAAGIAEIANRDMAAAEASFKKAIELDGTRVEAYRDLSNLYLSTGRYADAESNLVRGVEKNPLNEQMQFALADLYSRSGATAKASAVVESIKKQGKFSARILSDAGDFWHYHNRPLQAVAEYEASFSAKPSDVVDMKLVNEYITLGKTAEAQHWNDQLLHRNPKDHSALVFQGAIDELAGRTKDAIAILRPEVANDPSSIFANYYLGASYLAQGDLENAQERFTQCLKYDRNFLYAHLKLAQVLLLKNDPSGAADNAKEAIALNPRMADGYLLDADAAMALQKWPEVEAALGVADRIAPGNYVVSERWAAYFALKGNFPRAEQEYKKALGASLKPIDTLSRMVAMYIQTGHAASGVEATKAYIAEHGGDPRLFNLLAQLYAAQNQPKEVMTAAQSSLGLDPKNETAWILLAQAQEGLGEYDKAESSYNRAIQLQPGKAAPYALWADLSLQRGNFSRAVDLYRQALSVEPNSPRLQAGMARALAEVGKDPRQALTLAQEAERSQPMDPVISDRLAWVYHKSGMDRMAIPLLLECLKKQPANPLFQYDTGMVYLQTGDQNIGRHYLELSLKSGLAGPYSTEARRVLSAGPH